MALGALHTHSQAGLTWHCGARGYSSTSLTDRWSSSTRSARAVPPHVPRPHPLCCCVLLQSPGCLSQARGHRSVQRVPRTATSGAAQLRPVWGVPSSCSAQTRACRHRQAAHAAAFRLIPERAADTPAAATVPPSPPLFSFLSLFFFKRSPITGLAPS